MWRWALVAALCGLVAVGCGDSKSTTTTTTTTRAAAIGATTTAGGSAATTTTRAGTAGTTDLCAVVTSAVVADVTKITPTRSSNSTACEYNGPNGLFVIMTQNKLAKADQATFDTFVKNQESSATITKVAGLGDGDGASVKHDINTTVYGRKGTTVVAATVFAPAPDPAANARTFVEKALAAV